MPRSEGTLGSPSLLLCDVSLPSGSTPHSPRRTCASPQFATGATEVPYVMQQLGHVDPAATLGICAKVMLRRDGEQERLKALVQGGDPPANGRRADAGERQMVPGRRAAGGS